MKTRILLVFHADGRLYFSTQAPEAFEDMGRWERMGYVVKDLEVEICVPEWETCPVAL